VLKLKREQGSVKQPLSSRTFSSIREMRKSNPARESEVVIFQNDLKDIAVFHQLLFRIGVGIKDFGVRLQQL
jgi:hypothetical protein